MNIEYTIWDKNDNLLVQGNENECAKYLNMTIKTFRSTMSKVKLGKRKKYQVLVTDLDEIKEEEDE